MMSKGIIILKALIAKRRLRSICMEFDISYKYCHAVSDGKKEPSLDLMKKLRFLIPMDYWADDADREFIEQVRENLKKEESSAQ